MVCRLYYVSGPAACCLLVRAVASSSSGAGWPGRRQEVDGRRESWQEMAESLDRRIKKLQRTRGKKPEALVTEKLSLWGQEL